MYIEYIYIYIYICIYVMYVCMYVCMYACVYACVYVCMYVCIDTPKMNRSSTKPSFFSISYEEAGNQYTISLPAII